MRLQELFENFITVRVDQDFSDMTFEFPFDEEEAYEDISEVPEPLIPLVQVITPIDQDYRGQHPASSVFPGLASAYASSPELAYYVGRDSGKVYQQDLLNIPHTVQAIEGMDKQQLMSLLTPHILPHRKGDVGAETRH